MEQDPSSSPKRKGGRPPKQESKKIKSRSIHMTAQQEQILLEKMHAIGFKTFSEFVLFLCLENLNRVKLVPSANTELVTQIQKIGVNLNQIARAANTLKTVESKQELLAMTTKIAKQLREVMVDLNPKLATKNDH